MSDQPIPVRAAREVATYCDKDIVVIVGYDHINRQIHCATWGRGAEDKLQAAALGEILATAAGGDLSRQRTFQDFRTVDAARYAAMAGEAKALLEGLLRADAVGPPAWRSQIQEFLTRYHARVTQA